jgi:DNA-binding Lrp family transcriptional regulator
MEALPNMDEIDRTILAELQSDARRSNKAIAAAAGVAPSTSLTRIRELETAGVVRGYHADVDPKALGRHIGALVSVRLSPKSEALVDRFIDSLWGLDEVVAITLLTGPYDLQVELSVPSIEGLRTLVLENIASFDGVSDEQTVIVFERRRKPVLAPLA